MYTPHRPPTYIRTCVQPPLRTFPLAYTGELFKAPLEVIRPAEFTHSILGETFSKGSCRVIQSAAIAMMCQLRSYVRIPPGREHRDV